MGKVSSRLFMFSVVAGICICILYGCGAAEQGSSQQLSVEYKLAVINSGNNSLGQNDPAVVEMRNLLNSLQEKFSNSRTQISDIAVHAWTVLKEKGKPTPLIEVMQSLDRIPPKGSPKLDIAEVAAAWVVLKTSK